MKALKKIAAFIVLVGTIPAVLTAVALVFRLVVALFPNFLYTSAIGVVFIVGMVLLGNEVRKLLYWALVTLKMLDP